MPTRVCTRAADICLMGRVLGWITGIACFVAMFAFLPTGGGCRDGWNSPSIGRRGACSHHGGVDRSGNVFIFIYAVVSTFVGMGVAESNGVRRIESRYFPKPPPPPPPPPRAPRPHVSPREGDLACPQCGSAMRLRKARFGPRRGKLFWGCSRFPDCRGTRAH